MENADLLDDPLNDPLMDPLEEYERRTATPLVLLALVFLALYAAQVLWLSSPPAADVVIVGAQWAIWAVFLGDFLYRVHLAPRRMRYVLSHPVDVLTLVLPMLRPLRALRIFAAARVLIDRSHHVSYGRLAAAIGGVAVFVVLVGALAVLDFERFAAGSTITTFHEALWWSVVTITTVGYGDLSPVTGGGQIAATVMMIVGISIIGAVTASLASWFTVRIQGDQDDVNAAILSELAAVRAELAQLRAASGNDPAGGP